MPSRCSPQSTLQYHTLPSSVDYNPYHTQNACVDWGRPSYVGQVGHVGQVGSYSPYPDDGESSPYTTQPPSFILPNTDPMSTNNTYYVHAHGVRPHPTSLWPEPQQYVTQPTPQLPNTTYTMISEPTQSFGIASNLPSDRILPQPFTARSSMPTLTSSIDIPISAVGRHSRGYWHGEKNTSVQQLPTPVEPNGSQEQALERGNMSYRVQEVSYGQTNSSESLPSMATSSGNYHLLNEPQPSASTAASEDATSHESALSLIPPESRKSGIESATTTYGYRSSQLRSACDQLTPGPLYCRTTMIPRRELGSDECSPDCSSCQTTESTRTSFTSSLSNAGSGC